MSQLAWWRPELKRFAPLITQSSPSRTAVVSSQVASLPWFGSVSPKPTRCVAGDHPWQELRLLLLACRTRHIMDHAGSSRRSRTRSAGRCAGRGPSRARCSRMIAIARFEPSWPPSSFGQRVAQVAGASARRRISPSSSSHSRRGRAAVLPVGARVLAAVVEVLRCSARSSGLISRSMKASSSSSLRWISSGIVKSMGVRPLRSEILAHRARRSEGRRRPPGQARPEAAV